MIDASAPALLVEALQVRAGARILLDDVSLEVAPGERVALLGPSGSGKSLAASAVTGTLPAGLRATGRIHVAGVTVLPSSSPAESPAALVRQDSQLALNPVTRVGTQLELPFRAEGRRSARDRALAAARTVGLDADHLARLPGELSGGQRQRACVALAIATGAPLLIADEPTTALDPVTQAQVLDALDAVPAALVLITHDLAVARRVCSRIVTLAA